jgi:hypothetical protein
MQPQFCSPNNQNNKYSCFNNSSLINIAESFNNHYPDKKIEIPEKLNSKNRENFWKQLKSSMNKETYCDNERCWLDKPIIKNISDNQIDKSFRPEKPYSWYQNKNTWLSTTDINNVLLQYEINSDLKYIGAVPIDFDEELSPGICVVNELCKLNLEKLYLKGYRKLAIVFNFDPHDQSGSHWVSMFVDLNNGGIYYFDSYGKEPPNEIGNLMERIRIMGNDLIKKEIIPNLDNEHQIVSKLVQKGGEKISFSNEFIPDTPTYIFNSKNSKTKLVQENLNNNQIKISEGGKYDYVIQKGFRKFFNNIRFQFEGSECGVYSIHFITELLKGKKFFDVIHNIVDDKTINKQRDFFYRPIVQ